MAERSRRQNEPRFTQQRITAKSRQNEAEQQTWRSAAEGKMSRVGQDHKYTAHDRIFVDFPAKHTVYAPYV
jgi:hypothetical protein